MADIRYQYHYIKGLLSRYGFFGLFLKTLERRQSPMLSYASCYRRYLPTKEEIAWQKNTLLSYAPLVSIVVPAYETPRVYLHQLMDSVQAQSYPNWELCIADGSKTDMVEQAAAEYAKRDERIRYIRLSGNGGISENTNGGLNAAKGSYIVLMDHDDLVTPNALYEMVKCLNEASDDGRKMALIYSDEDKINSDGTVYSRPHFKPDFNREFLRHNNYFCHLLMFSRTLLQAAGEFGKEYDGAQDYDFVLRCVDAGAVVRHVPKILYHWRIHEGSTAGNSGDKLYAFDSGCRAIEAHLKRCGQPGRVNVTESLGVYRVFYELKGTYTITVVAEDSRQLRKIKKYYDRQHYPEKEYKLEIQFIQPETLTNVMESGSIGDYILYIRKKTRVKPKGLIEGLLGICQQEKNGIAAAKLLTTNRRVDSCGLVYDSQGNMIPLCGGIYAGYKGYFLHAVIAKNVSAAALHCAMIKRKAFCEAGGFDEEMSGIYRDADLCFRLEEAGYDIVVTPEVTAVCRQDGGKDCLPQARKRFLERWKQKLALPDPCYNRNLSLTPGHTYAMKEQR